MKIEEITRIKDINMTSSYKTQCIHCRRMIELRFNGGELDHEKCCNLTYLLEHSQIDFVIIKSS